MYMQIRNPVVCDASKGVYKVITRPLLEEKHAFPLTEFVPRPLSALLDRSYFIHVFPRPSLRSRILEGKIM